MPDSPAPAAHLEPTVFVLFGASGDLAERLVLPAFFRLAQEELLPADWRLIGSGRRDPGDEQFRSDVHDALREFGPAPEDGPWDDFSGRLHFAGGGFTVDDPGQLLDAIHAARSEMGDDVRLVHYLGLPPSVFADYTRALAAHDLVDGARVVYEKPFGTSADSFRSLDRVVHETLDESQVFRIDHFLGKEATQELRALRFANGLFGSSWDAQHIAAVQIDVPETLDVDQRAEFYDATGATLDMLVTHLFQVAAEIAMEPPSSLSADAIAQARADAVRAFRPLAADDVVRGQFRGYRDIDEVADDSHTDTFVAARMWIDSDRWRGVPFLMRTGKRMAESHQKVNLIFRDPQEGPVRGEDLPRHGNVLCFDLSGNGALALAMNVKLPGTSLEVDTVWTQIPLDTLSGGDPLPPYVRLIHDVLAGDRTLFTRPDGLEEVWQAIGAAVDDTEKPYDYEPGSWGPQEALRLAEPVGWVLGHEA